MPQADVHRFEGANHLLPEDRDIATPRNTGSLGPHRNRAGTVEVAIQDAVRS
jgi:hypothetical protein